MAVSIMMDAGKIITKNNKKYKLNQNSKVLEIGCKKVLLYDLKSIIPKLELLNRKS